MVCGPDRRHARDGWVVMGRHTAFKFAIATLSLALGAVAAGADDVKIVRRDGTVVEGQLKSFEDGVYVVATPAGEVAVDVGKVTSIDIAGVPKPAGAPASGGGTPPAGPSGGIVTMTTTANVQIVGRIIGFEDGVYEIETPGGPQRVPVASVARIEPSGGGSASPPAAAHEVLVELSGEPLSISGSRTLGELAVRQLVESYAQQGGAAGPVWAQRGSSTERTFQAKTAGGTTFNVAMSLKGTLGGIDDLIQGRAQIAMLERRMTAAEAQRVAAAGLGDPLAPGNEVIIGPSATVVVVHPSNPVKALTFAQIAGIFSGRIRNWSEVGGANRRIQVLAPAAGSSLIEAAQTGLGDPFEILGSARRTGSSLETADLAGADPAAIGLAHSDYRGNTVAVAITSNCGMTFEPSLFNIESETYPLWSRLVLYTTSKATPAVRAFLNFAQSSKAQRILRERGLSNLTPSIAEKGEVKLDRALAAKIADASSKFLDVAAGFVAAAARMTVTFRFEPGSEQLDSRAVADIDRLADFVKSGALGGRRLALVGYAESSGNFTADVAQSKARAVAVSEALQKKGLTIERLFGFGPLLPADCDRSPGSQQRNRRVEVWVE